MKFTWSLFDDKSKHSLEEVRRGLSALILFLRSIMVDPENEEKGGIKPNSKSLARLFFELFEPYYLMKLLKRTPKVICFRESIYF